MQKTYKKTHIRGIGIFAVLIAAAVMGCAWPGPHLQHNSEVERHFDGYQIYPQYQYYTAGTLEDPRAIVALKEGYALDSPEWTKVSMTPDTLEMWITAMKKGDFVDENQLPNGAHLIGRNGEVAGHYYSVWQHPLVRVPEEKTIAMNIPLNELRNTNRFWIEMNYDGGIGKFGGDY